MQFHTFLLESEFILWLLRAVVENLEKFQEMYSVYTKGIYITFTCHNLTSKNIKRNNITQLSRYAVILHLQFKVEILIQNYSNTFKRVFLISFLLLC
jgi:hypothetical protein